MLTSSNRALSILLAIALIGSLAATGPVAATSFDAADLENELFWAGQQIEITGLEPDSVVELRSGDDTDSTFDREYVTDEDGSFVLDTTEKTTGSYFLRGAGSSGTDAIFEIIGSESEDDDETNKTDERYTLTVTVEDTDEAPISTANVSLNESVESVDKNGTVTTELQNGSYTVTADAAGYENATDSVDIDGANESVTLTLQAEDDNETDDSVSEADDTNESDDLPSEADDEHTETDDSPPETDDRDNETDADPPADDQPGFGLLAALLALVALTTHLVRRR